LPDKTDNPVRGTVPIEIGGVTYIMRLNWHGIAQIRELYPDGYDLMDVKTLATIMSICLPGNPDMTADKIMDEAPAIEPSIEKVSDMINYSWFGAKVPDNTEKKEEPENPPIKAATKG
jgi:hypothetical protein